MPNIRIKTKSDNMEIIASGQGFTFRGNSDFKVYLNFDETFQFIVKFQFNEDVSTNKATLKTISDLEKNVITIICINFADFIGTGPLEPLNIATYVGKKIYLKFWVSTTEEKTTREIRYCFYMEQDDDEKHKD